MKGAEILIKALENEEVKYVFGLPGEEIRDLMAALKTSPIQFVMTRHEQGAAFMADVYGRLTGKAGVCLSTLGPGATNLLTGIADAHMDYSPVVAITGQGALTRLYKESHQVINVIRMFFPVTKWTDRITHPRSIPEMVRKAFKMAEMEKPGVTHLELPEDIAAQSIAAPPILTRTSVRRSGPERKSLKDALTLLKNAKKPFILCGNGAIRKRSSEVLRRIVAKTKMPVISTFMGKGAVSDRESESLLTLGLGADRQVFDVINAADLVLSVGYDIAEYGPEKWHKKNNLKIIHVDFASAEVYEQYIPDVELIGDISDIMRAIEDELDQVYDFPEARAYRQDIEARWATHKNTKTLTPEYILHVLREVMDDHDILISDVGSHKMWVGSKFSTYEPNTVLISNGFATMGIALPGAIGAKLACPNKKVVSLNGDGGVLMNIQELETATRLGLAFPVLIFNDSSFSLIEEKFRNENAITDPLTFKNPNFEELAKAFGCESRVVHTVDELKPALEYAMNCSTVCLVDLHIDRNANQGLF